MKPGVRLALVPSLLLALAAVGSAAHAADPAIKCEAAKLKLAGKYAACRLKADATALLQGVPADYTTCDGKLANSWATVEAALGDDCPVIGDVDDIQDLIVTCTEVVPPQFYDVVFKLSSSSTVLEGVQFHVDYSAAGGDFAGSAASVQCTNLNAGSLFAANDVDATTTLTMGWISLSGYSAPQQLAKCVFQRTGLLAPSASDLVPVLDDCHDLVGDPATCTVEVESITPQ